MTVCKTDTVRNDIPILGITLTNIDQFSFFSKFFRLKVSQRFDSRCSIQLTSRCHHSQQQKVSYCMTSMYNNFTASSFCSATTRNRRVACASYTSLPCLALFRLLCAIAQSHMHRHLQALGPPPRKCNGKICLNCNIVVCTKGPKLLPPDTFHELKIYLYVSKCVCLCSQGLVPNPMLLPYSLAGFKGPLHGRKGRSGWRGKEKKREGKEKKKGMEGERTMSE